MAFVNISGMGRIGFRELRLFFLSEGFLSSLSSSLEWRENADEMCVELVDELSDDLSEEEDG